MGKKRGVSLIIEQPLPMRKQVYEHLRNQILSHAIEPSSRLVEAQIAKEIGTSRTPVREAMHLLEKDGFVESIPRVGYRVKQLAWEELDEIVEIRKVNETLACRWAVQRIDAKSLQALEKNLNLAESTLDRGHPEAFVKYDEEFHEILVRASGSPHLFALCQQLRRLMGRYRFASINNALTVHSAIQGHHRILDALKTGDEKGIEAAMMEHLSYAKESIKKSSLPGPQAG
jgi:DNA-binding GntR family transcriptional regulator